MTPTPQATSERAQLLKDIEYLHGTGGCAEARTFRSMLALIDHLAARAPAEQGVPDGIKINQMRAPSHRRDGQFYVTRNDGMYLSTEGTWMLSCIDGWFKTREEAAATLRAALAAKPAPPADAVQRVVSAAKAYVACAATGQDPTTEYDELRAAVAALEER